MKLIRSITIALILALALSVFPAFAATPLQVSIVSQMPSVNPEGNLPGTFTASGAAVDAGMICPAGEVYDIANPAVGWQSNSVIVLFVHKHFICSDGSGSFEMNMNVFINVKTSPSQVTARWIIVSGDGNYTHLLGNGRLFAEWTSENSLIDNYYGNLHLE